jgi:hypothetical protein
MKIYTTIKEASFTAKSKASGKVVNFASQQNRDNAIKSGEYEETDGPAADTAPAKPKVNIFDKPKPATQPTSDKDSAEPKAPLKAAPVVKTPVDVLKSKVEKWSDKEKAFFRDGIHKEDSPERRNWKDAIKDKAKGAIAAIKKGAKHEVEEFKAAGAGVKNFFSGKELSEHEKKALKAVAIKVATTAIFGAVTGGAGHGVLAFGKHVAMEFIPHVVGETILKGAGTAALFAGDEDEDAEMERFMQIIADKMASEKITPELMTQMVDSYNAKKDEGDTVNEEVRELTPDQSEMVQGIIDMLLQIDDIDNRMKVAQQQIQNFKDEEIVFNYAWFLSAAGLDNNDEPVRMDVKTQPQHIINKESIMIGKINEDFKHIIHVDTPTQVVSKPIAAQILALAKKGIRSKDIGLEMGFVGNAKLATDAFQKVKNKIYFELGNKNESVNEAFNIKHLPTWLFDDPIDFMEWYEDDMELKIGRIPPFNKADELTLLRLVKAWMEAEDDYSDGRGDLGTGKQGAARAASYKAQDAIKQFLNKKSKVANESVNEVASRTAMEIGGLTGMNKDAIQKFVDEHNLDIEKVFQFVKKGKLPARMDFMTAVVGKPGNPIQKKIIKMLGESVNEGSHGMATKLLQSIVSGDSSRAEGTKMSKELAQHYIDWIRTSPFGKKNSNLPLDMLVKASFNWGIERGLDSKLKGELSKLKSTIKESVNESLIANDGKILLNGKTVGYYDYDRGSAAFWTTDLSDKQFRGDKAFDTKEEMLAFFKKYLSKAAKALEYQRKALSKFGIKYPADESVNEAKYPTNLYVGSVIYGQGFTGLKGIEGGKYYKVVEMDDTTATLAPCDQKGKITGSKKVRHKLDSIEGGIKTAKRGDENGIVIESVNEERILVRKVMGDDAEKFLKKYPKVKQVMSVIAKKNTDLMKGYKAFLKFKDAQEDYLGGRAEVSSSPTFGSKTFYKYDWGNLKNHWPEVYQYIYTLHFGGLDGATVEGINEAMGNDKSMLALVDILSNSMEYYEDDSDFLQAVRGGQGWSGIAGFKNSSLIPVFKSIYKKYWTVSPQNRTNWITKDWINWLKPFGLEENVNSETDTIEETTLNEKQFKGLEGIPANKSLEKISKAEKLNIIKAKGNIISFIVPDEYKGKRNFWQVISAGNIKKSSSGNIVMLMGGGPMNSPSFKTIDDLIDGVDWKSMEEKRRFNESVNESTPGEQIQNLNNRLTKLRQDMAKAKSPEAKNVIQARMKNALQKLSDKKKDMGIKKP